MNNIRTLLKITKALQAGTKLQVEATQLTALFEIYAAGAYELTIKELGEKVGVTGAAAGRMAATLSTGHSSAKMEGWGLAEIFYDPLRPKCKVVRLTAKGNRLIEEVIGMI